MMSGDPDDIGGESPMEHSMDNPDPDVSLFLNDFNGLEEDFELDTKGPELQPDENFRSINIGSIISKTTKTRMPVGKKRKLEELLKDDTKEEAKGDDDEAEFGKSIDDLPNMKTLSYKYVPKTHLKPKPAKWSKEEVSRLYRGLSMFGTSFTLITNLFPGREVQEVRRRYRYEEVHNKDKVSKALRETHKVDVQKYQKYKMLSEKARAAKKEREDAQELDIHGPLVDYEVDDSFEAKPVENTTDSNMLSALLAETGTMELQDLIKDTMEPQTGEGAEDDEDDDGWQKSQNRFAPQSTKFDDNGWAE